MAGTVAGSPRFGRRRIFAAALAVLLAVTTAGSLNAESSSITAAVRVAGVDVALTLSSAAGRVGDTIKATATVTNAGPDLLSSVSVTLRVDARGLRIRGSDTITIASLRAGRASKASWSLCALQPGNYVILARATVGGVAVDSVAVLLSVSGQRRKGCA